MSKNIAVFIGSASQTSYNHAVVRHLQNIAPSDLQFNVVELGDLPVYDRDLDEQDVPAYNRVREAIKAADACLWVSPEHNGQASAMLKNAIDVGSRPSGQSLWIGKKVGLVCVSAHGTDKVTNQLKDLAQAHYINMQVAPVAANVGGIFSGAFNEQQEIVSDEVKATLQHFVNEFAKFVA